MTSQPFRFGLAGFGTVGSGVVRLVVEEQERLGARFGRPVELVAVAVRDRTRPRTVPLPPATRLTEDWQDLVADPTIEAIVEVIGVDAEGSPNRARDIALATLEARKHFITANKSLIAAHGAELHDVAAKKQVLCLYEASVGAGIPVIGPLQQSLLANQVTGIHGILNGTCNYILTRMENQSSLTMEAAVREAQDLGYAEPDPTFDVGGHDAGYKIAILASLAFGCEVRVDHLHVDGIGKLGPMDLVAAREHGYALKLLASVEQAADGSITAEVGPALIPSHHVLSGVSGVTNAVLFKGDPIGDVLCAGPGAGPASTASGLLADAALAARTPAGSTNPYPFAIPRRAPVLHPEEGTPLPHYLRIPREAQPHIPKDAIAVVLATEPDEIAIRTIPMSRSAFHKLLGSLTHHGISSSNIVQARFPFEPPTRP